MGASVVTFEHIHSIIQSVYVVFIFIALDLSLLIRLFISL